jgi:hypothetical protein
MELGDAGLIGATDLLESVGNVGHEIAEATRPHLRVNRVSLRQVRSNFGVRKVKLRSADSLANGRHCLRGTHATALGLHFRASLATGDLGPER